MSTPALTFTDAIAAEQEAYVAALENELSNFFEYQREILSNITNEALPLLESIQKLSTGGKRLRALLAYWGWRGAGGAPDSPAIARAGAAIELFQSAALIHDDIIDRSETRRGAPAVHKWFEATHRKNSWRTASDAYGTSSAILAGDLCLSWSEEMFSSVGEASRSGSAARKIFDLMRTEVMAGQYLDILGEVIPSNGAEASQQRAEHVVRYKSAKYSCEHPLALGGALASGISYQETSELIDAYRRFALPLGEGFQLRDDVLGVFGKPEETGKPAGDDLKEGKRTVLIALTQKLASQDDWEKLDRALGNQELTSEDIVQLQQIITTSEALEEHESMILAKGSTVDQALEHIQVEPMVKQALAQIANKALHRSS